MVNHPNLTSSWALSFQNFTRAMQETQAAEDGERQVPVMPKSKAKAELQALALNFPPWHHDVAGVGWELMEPDFELATSSAKRALSPEKKEDNMAITRDMVRETQLTTGIAILQRELDILKNQNNSRVVPSH